ncbi:hypothetical protein BDZ89DRAFT_1168621 [Hymenopellis radicata]|nr:hypothetical protein BDZ89DRAFT_1168621 [Hymenopellis radicata]
MRLLLEIQASLAMDMMPDMSDFAFENDDVLRNPNFIINCQFVPSFVYDELEGGVSRPFYDAYTAVFEAAWKFLRLTPPRNFNAKTLNSYVQTEGFAEKTEEFFEVGGEVENVLDAITHNALEEHREQEHDFEEDPDFMALPECRNDFRFSLVRKRLGLSRDKTWGPYQL